MTRLTTAALCCILFATSGARAQQPIGAPQHAALGDEQLFSEAAVIAWRYIEQQTQPETGLVNSVVGYPYATVWDIGSTIAALHSAHALGLVDTSGFDERMSRLLRTVRGLRLYQDRAFNKNYRTATAAMAGRNDREDSPASSGYGWSVMDIGRLLVWLRVVATSHPQHRDAAEAIVARLDFGRLVRDGQLWGEDVDGQGSPRVYQEGRVGYEQYAASGFALWGHRAATALDLHAFADPVVVLGVPLLLDRRGDAHLTSEPFVLMGLEVGWPLEIRSLAWRILETQRRRYEATKQITIASEDAIPVAPHYFYYYSIHEAGEDFAIRAMSSDENLGSPRWISAKAAYGWHALLPSEYTRRAVESVAPARSIHGWSSGVFEASGRSTGAENINTAAVILEAALYAKRGRPLLYP